MISVVIPCYNAAAFVAETIYSILAQEEDMEIIVVDDGSADSSAAVVQAISSPRLSYLYQENQGVSAARNKGFIRAKGEYVIFFDADDKMSEGFLAARKKVMDEDKSVGFCCGTVINFPGEPKITFGVSDDVAEALLTYHPQYSSCPSNYLIRKSVLVDNCLFFHEGLLSTADRFFLLQLAEKTKGKLINTSPLYYRISPESMSNKLSKKLILDNEKYFNELRSHGLIPGRNTREFFFKIQFILGLGFLKTGVYNKGIKYTIQAFLKSPLRFIKQII